MTTLSISQEHHTSYLRNLAAGDFFKLLPLKGGDSLYLVVRDVEKSTRQVVNLTTQTTVPIMGFNGDTEVIKLETVYITYTINQNNVS